MPEFDDAALERRLRDVLEAQLGALPLDLTVEALDRRRAAGPGTGRRFGRGRASTLLAAAVVLVGGAVAAGSGILRLPSVPPVPAPSSVAIATPDPTSPGRTESPAPSTGAPIAGPGGAWIPTGSLLTTRTNPSAVRLQDGRVLVLGGHSGPSGYAEDATSAELYDPSTGTWSAAGSISKPILDATLLRDGRVLVLVGFPEGGRRSAELFDPTNGTWTATGPLASGLESDGTLTVLHDGRVLLSARDGAQIYDPASGTWTATGPSVGGSFGDRVTLLRDGRVLDWAEAQVYDPATGTWTATGKRNHEGFGMTAVLLADGRVLVAGGRGFRLPDDYFDLDTAEVYDPVTGSWTVLANMNAKTMPIAAFPQPDGTVLVVAPEHAEVYDPVTGTWTTLPYGPGVVYSTATMLSDGTVLLTEDGEEACAADRYDPRSGAWTPASTMLGCGAGRSFTLLLDGTILVAGGFECVAEGECQSSGAAELYVPAGVAMPPFPAFPSPASPAASSPTPRPTPFPPAAGPVPPNARSWTVTVDNRSSEAATLFVVGAGRELVGSATPNVIPAGATVEVTFLFPVDDDGEIHVNWRPGGGGGLVSADQIGIPGKILVTADGQVGWLSP